MRTMYDSVTAPHIPQTARMVAGYVNGLYRWSNEDWSLFPNAVKVRIATQANINDGIVGDSEPGDMTPAQLVSWVRMRRAAGIDPTGYCSLGEVVRNGTVYGWNACRAAFAEAEEPEPHWWIAAYPGPGPVLPAGAVAHQYASDTTGSGGHYDLSVVADYWPGVDPVPLPVLAPAGAAPIAVLED